MKIITEKLIPKSGVPSRRMVKFERVMRQDQLPKEYKKGEHFYRLGDSIVIQKHSHSSMITKGQIIDETTFQEHLKFIMKKGNELHRLMNRIRKEREHWQGIETFNI